MTAALVSIYTRRRVRHDVAMTGEITLRGLVLPVGGIKEKVLAARRAGITLVVLPERNRADVEEIKDETMEGLDVQYVKRIDEALGLLLEAEPTGDPAVMFHIPDSEKHPVPAPAPMVEVVSDGSAEPAVR